jgi:O-antigen/teichoic acid export membrane protein
MTGHAPGSEAAAAIPAPSAARVLRNTGAQMVGRVAIALSRLVVAAIVVRSLGAGTFGEYALVLGLLVFAEWLVDFGATEIFVRELVREPGRQAQLVRIVAALKLVQVPVAIVVLAGMVLALRYPEHVLHAALLGGASVAFFAGVLVFRVIFKARLALEREVIAEFTSALAMIAMVVVAVRMGGGLVALLGCHAASRAIFLALCMALGRREFRLSVQGVSAAQLRHGAAMALPVGVIGLLVAAYEMVDILLLSKLATTVELAYYSAAQRLLWPILLALGAIAGTLYPIAARYWPAEPARFSAACQRGLDAVVLLAGLALASALAGAGFFLGLLDAALVPGTPAMQLLALLLFAKAVSSTLGPVLYIVRTQRQTLLFVSVAVVMKAVAITLLVLQMGYLGAAVGALLVEVVFSTLPTVYLLRRHGGLRLDWSVCLRVLVAAAAAVAATSALLPGTSLAAAALAPLAYLAFAAALGALRMDDVRLLLRRGAP